MDNHAEKLYFAKGYLAGLIDGEGSLTINVHRFRKKMKLQVSIQITNTNPEIMLVVAEMAKYLKLPFYFQESKRITKNKPVTRMLIHGLKRCKRWLEIIPIKGKIKEAEILNKFILSREENIKNFGQNKPYTEYELRLVKELRNLHGNGKRGNRMTDEQMKLYQETVESTLWKRQKIMELIQKGWTQTKIASFFGIKPNAMNEWLKRNIKLSETTIGTLIWHQGKRNGAQIVKE